MLGSYHAAAVSNKRNSFYLMSGNSGQLGRGNVVNNDIVRQVTLLNRIVIILIACGDSHTCALSQVSDL